MTGLLHDKVTLITGAASGIGRASAELFARHGAKVVVADVTDPAGEATVKGIRAAGGDGIFVHCDVGQMDEVGRLVDKTLAEYGRLDVIFSNAAAVALGDAVKLSEKDWDFTLDVCLKATWMLAHCGVPPMLAGGGGVIVVTSSVQGIRGYANHAAYQAAKGGLQALVRSMAADFAPKIRVNAILPGSVMTGLSAKMTERQKEITAAMCPLKRNGQPEDIAQAALFLASDMSSYITGTQLVVDGGLTAVIEVPQDH